MLGVERLLEPYWAEHSALLVDADARSSARVQIERSPNELWPVRQTLSDPEENYDYALSFVVDLGASRDSDRLVMRWLGLGSG